MTGCNHHSLYFGSGSYHIFCHHCGQCWTTDDAEEGYNMLSGIGRYSYTDLYMKWLEALGLIETINFVMWREE